MFYFPYFWEPQTLQTVVALLLVLSTFLEQLHVLEIINSEVISVCKLHCHSPKQTFWE